MRFLFETYKQHHDEGLAAHKQKDYSAARTHYLLAAKYLCAMAKEKDAEFREERLKKAERLVEIARELAGKAGQAKNEKKGVSAENPEEEVAGGKKDRWIIAKPPETRFSDVAGLEDVKRLIRLRVLYPLQHPEVKKRFGKKSGGGVLLYGPPGTGKTMIARAIACELESPFMSVRCSDIMSKWVGDAEKNIKEMFMTARAYTRCVIFMDETESIVSKRGGGSSVMNRVIPEFLAQIDGLERYENMLLLLGATNRPWDMDEAALRPGRFGELVYVGLPDAAARREIIQINLKDVPLATGVSAELLAERTEKYSGADILGFIEAMTDFPFQRQIETGIEQIVTAEDIDSAFKKVRPSVDSRMLDRYESYRKN